MITRLTRQLLPFFTLSVCLSQPAQAAATISDDTRVERAYQMVNALKCDKAIEGLCGPYIEAQASNDAAKAARYLLIMAQAFRADENLAACLVLCRQAEKLDQTSAAAKSFSADTLIRLGHLSEAKAILKTLDPQKDPLAARTWGLWCLTTGDRQDARRYLLKSKQLDPSDPIVHFRLCRLTDDAKEAAACLARAADTTASAYLRELFLYQAERKLHPLSPGRQHLLKAKAILSDDPAWRLQLCWLLAGQKHDAQAYALMKEAVSCPRLNFRCFSQLSLQASSRKDAKLALAALAYYEQVVPDSAAAAYALGQLAFSRKDYGQAKSRFEQAAKLSPQTDLYYATQCLLPLYEQSKDKQDELAAHWIAQCPDSALAWMYKGDCLRHRLQWQAALDAYEHSESLHRQYGDVGSYPSLAAGLSTGYYKLGKKTEALESALDYNAQRQEETNLVKVRLPKVDYDKLKGATSTATEHALLADALFDTEQYDDCVNEYRQAIAIQDDITWHRCLLKAYMEKGDYQSATREDLIVSNHAITRDIPQAVNDIWQQYAKKLPSK